MSRKLICLALAVMMTLALALTGCNSGNSGTTSAATTAATEAATTAASSEAATTAASTEATTAPSSDTAGGWDTGSIEVEPLGIDLEGAEIEYLSSMGLNDARTQVWAKASQYASETYNGNVTFTLADSAEYTSKIKTLLASGMAPDVFNTAYSTGFAELVAGEALLDLTDYIPQYLSRMYSKVSEDQYKAVTFGGRIYAMIPFKDLVANHSLLYDASQVEAAGLEVPDWIHYTDLKELLYQMRDWMDAQGREDDVVCSIMPDFWRDANVENIGNNSTCISAVYEDVCYIEGYTPYTQLFNLYGTPEFVDYIKYLNQTVTDRINPYDRDNFDKDNVKRNSGAYVFFWSMGYVAPPKGMTDYECALKMQAISLSYTSYTSAALSAVAADTEYPEAACKLMEILDNDKYLGTIMRFGEEGTHWTYTTDGQADCSIGDESKIKYWYGHHLGDITNCVLPTDVTTDFHQVLVDLNNSAIYSTNLGFTVDSTPIDAEIAAVAATYSEYLSATNLYSGMLDDATTEATIAEMNEKFYANGLQKMIDEYQSQLDAWHAANG